MGEASDFSKRLFKAVDSLDAEGYVSFLAEDVLVRFANNAPLRGRQAIREMLVGHLAGIQRMSHKVVNEFRDGDAVIQQLEVTMVRKNGAAGTVLGVNVLRLNDDELVYDYRVFIDTSPIDGKVPRIGPWSDPRTLTPKETIVAFVTAVNSKDSASIDKLIADDYLQHTQTIEDGAGSMKEYIKALFERHPEMYITLDNLLQDGDRVSAFSRIVLNDEVAVDAANIWVIRDGQLAEHWEITDESGARELEGVR